MVRKNEHMFEKISISSLAQEILLYLARSPGKEFYIRELARLLSASVGGCHSALKDLEDKGLVISRTSGRNRYYQVNEDNPSVINYKLFMNIQELSEILAHLAGLALRVVLFGSCSRGDDTHDSDIDLLIVTLVEDKVRKLLARTDVNGRQVQLIIKGPHEMVEMTERNPAFLEEIAKGIVLMRGIEDE